jgi:tripartite-type tricarboxylate transporter receptor subunit TctC
MSILGAFGGRGYLTRLKDSVVRRDLKLVPLNELDRRPVVEGHIHLEHALAVTTATRSETLPDAPTVSDFVPGYEASFWHGLGAPKGTPVEVVDKLNKEINAGLADPKMKLRLADLGGTVMVGSPADFGKFIADEIEKWGKVVKFAGLKPE